MQSQKLTTIYATHYFDGENKLPKSDLFWEFTELDMTQSAFVAFLKFIKPNLKEDDEEKLVNDFLKKHYPQIIEAEGTADGFTIIKGFQFYLPKAKSKQNQYKNDIARMIYEDAEQVLSTSSGDDSYFDYDPGYAYYVISLLKQLNTKVSLSFATSLQDTLEHRED